MSDSGYPPGHVNKPVYLHHNAAQLLAAGGDVEEDFCVRHFSQNWGDWTEKVPGDGWKRSEDSERKTAADEVYITGRWAAKTSQLSTLQHVIDSYGSQSATRRHDPPLSAAF